MRERLVHRGPDSGGELSDEHAAIGVRRLRVIDLATGDQPLWNEDRTIACVLNGEIYNFAELRDELVRAGHRFVSTGDTEVIVHLYEEVGEEFPRRLDGMFALAVWDRAARKLVLARDRMGKKPLLYSTDGGELVFASEHSALLAGMPAGARADTDAIRMYLRLGWVPAPHDAFAGVRKLLPGHSLVWTDGRVEIAPYWVLPPSEPIQIDADEAAGELRRLVEEAVAKRLVADVPVGAFLSGGVDSSAVVATMARLTDRVKTFTIGFEDDAYSELAHARRVAEKFSTDHHEFTVTSAHADIAGLLVRHFGEPYADSSAIPAYYLARSTREHVTVALNGDGGDELFGGYERYTGMWWAGRIDRVPRAVRAPAARGIAALLGPAAQHNGSLRRARNFLDASALEACDRYTRWLGVFDEASLRALIDPGFAEITRDAERRIPIRSDGFRTLDAATASMRVDLTTYLPDDLLAKVDITSMANSLEVRSPLLDRKIVEFALRLPLSLKIGGGQRKRVLKKAFDGVVPHENMYRPKQGFSAPVSAWLRKDLRHYARELLLSSVSLDRGYFRRSGVERILDDHESERRDRTYQLWSLVMLELWHREFIDA